MHKRQNKTQLSYHTIWGDQLTVGILSTVGLILLLLGIISLNSHELTRILQTLPQSSKTLTLVY
jgi:hypothetical protein